MAHKAPYFSGNGRPKASTQASDELHARAIACLHDLDAADNFVIWKARMSATPDKSARQEVRG
jgi:hypothetical protein